MRQLPSIILAVPWLLGLLAGCSGGDADVRVFAASSLTEVMPRLVADFKREHPEVSLDVAYGGSQALAAQIEEGAPADVFISANPQQVERLGAAGLVAISRPVARNELVIAVAAGAGLGSIEQLANPNVAIAIGAAGVPVGALTQSFLRTLPPDLQRAIEANVITEDTNVRIVLSRVESGEAEAAFVYRTDVATSSSLRAIDLEGGPATVYTAATIADDRDPTAAAQAFLAYLASPGAAALLLEAGFAVLEASS